MSGIRHLMINGKAHVGWRIDDVGDGQERTGLAFLLSPFALVPKRDNAEEICQAANSWRHLVEALLEFRTKDGDETTPPCWCPPNYPALNEGRHSLPCNKSRIAFAKSRERA